MKIGTALAVAVTAVCVQVASARADEHERRGEERRAEDRPDMRHEEHPARRPRPEPPKFQPHPRGIHPRGATVHPHAVRVMRPHIAKFGVHQYPVTEEVMHGFGLVQMSTVEDDALDRCYEESGGDQSCFLATCSHF